MQVVVVGEDLCMVSGCALGLVSLMNPLQWVSTFLPILPSKYHMLLEAPVPFLVGITQLPQDLPADCDGVMVSMGMILLIVNG